MGERVRQFFVDKTIAVLREDGPRSFSGMMPGHDASSPQVLFRLGTYALNMNKVRSSIT